MKKLLTIVISTIMFCTCFGCVLTQPSSSSMEQSSLSSSESSSSSAEDPITEETLDYIDVSSSTLTSEQKAEVNELFYQNDLNTTSADPACIYCEDDGYFYMYGTGHSNFNCYRSKDLTSWQALTPAFKQPKDMTYSEVSSIMTQTEFNNYKNNTWLKNAYDWAPGVIYDADLDLYLMFFSARYTNTNPLKLQLTLATSKTPYGPFIQWTGKVNGANGAEGVDTITYENGQTVPAYEIDYDQAFIDFVEMRKRIKKPMTDRAIKMALNKLKKLATNEITNEFDIDVATAILEQSIFKSWTDLYPLRGENNNNSRGVDWRTI